ncbi:MAG: hypothetical protein PSX81_07985 [bacterium]|nr:hypothetical protein [bacterium]
MKKSISILSVAAIAAVFFFSACEKDEGNLPNIAFKTGGQYVSANDSVQQGDTVIVGIKASKAEEKDVLKSFDGSSSFDNAASTSFVSESLSGGNQDNFEKDMVLIARKQAGKEQYTFTVVNKDGLKNAVSLTLFVK